jgi:hypothetical protein
MAKVVIPNIEKYLGQVEKVKGWSGYFHKPSTGQRFFGIYIPIDQSRNHSYQAFSITKNGLEVPIEINPELLGQPNIYFANVKGVFEGKCLAIAFPILHPG